MNLTRVNLLIRLLSCYESEPDAHRKRRLGLLVLRLERRIYGY
jgi:hypothetical protein